MCECAFTSDSLTLDVVLLLPLSIIRSLHLRRRQAIALTGIFGIGTLSIAASTARFVAIYRVIVHSENAALSIQSTEQWSTVECATAMIAFCAPSFRSWLNGRKPATTPNAGQTGSQKIWTIGWRPWRQRRMESILESYVTTSSQIELRPESIPKDLQQISEADERAPQV